MTVQPTRDQLRALANAATPGPWNPHPAGKYVWTEELGGIIQNWSDDANAVADMEFIAAARNVLPQILDQLDRAEHRITRLEAQTSIRGRAVVMYRDRAREAEAERNEWKALALQERGAALDALEQIKVRDARIKAVRELHSEWLIGDPCENPIRGCKAEGCALHANGHGDRYFRHWRTVCAQCRTALPCATIRALD